MSSSSLQSWTWQKRRAAFIAEARAAGQEWCALCGQLLDFRKGAGRRPNGPSVDHIVPRVHGGGDEPSNLRLVCTSCNARGGQRIATKRKKAARRPSQPKARVFVSEPMVGPPGMQRPWGEW